MDGHAGNVKVDPRRRRGGKAQITTAEKIVKMHRGVLSDQMTGIVSRAGAVAGDMSIDGTGTGVNDGAGAGAGVGAAAAADSAS